MTRTLLATIKWDRVTTGNTYLYGSTVKFLEDSVYFENLLIASGKPISRWQSRTNYQGDRRSPALPILKPGATYVLETNLESVPAERIYVRLDFVNRLGETIDFIVLRKFSQEFTFPKEAFSYTITLMSGGCESVHFYDLKLYQLEDEKQVVLLEEPLAKRYVEGQMPADLDFVSPLIRTL